MCYDKDLIEFTKQTPALPLLIEYGDWYKLVGTVTVVRYHSRMFLITAGHCIRDAEEYCLLINEYKRLIVHTMNPNKVYVVTPNSDTVYQNSKEYGGLDLAFIPIAVEDEHYL